ncbi:MAG: AAA family ATPase, partial [Candidatus Anaerobiospirillum pullicola]|nr:AAA family ATPase [Candidatus Anaerobiospirillum pullicola]
MANLIGKDEEALNALPNVPLGVSKWDVLRNRNYLIVDKTAKLAKLVEFNMVFFARPRRMGKSTLCSMLYELFAHGTDKFVGQKIYDLWPEEKGRTYPVIRLSFNSIQGKDASDFEQALKGAVANAFSTAGFTEVKSFDQTKSLSGFLSQFNVIADQHWLVFLIDEWDHQLSNSLDKEDD